MIDIDAAKLKSDLDLHGFSTRVLASAGKLDGIRNAAQSQLDAAFRGDKAMDVEALRKISALWKEIKDVMEFFSPYKLDVSTGERVHSQLLMFRGMRECGLQILGLNNGDTQEPADNISGVKG